MTAMLRRQRRYTTRAKLYESLNGSKAKERRRKMSRSVADMERQLKIIIRRNKILNQSLEYAEDKFVTSQKDLEAFIRETDSTNQSIEYLDDELQDLHRTLARVQGTPNEQ
ncbi:hypothetical protein LSAT2_031104 [Lamellibrachia satsuma]|nr:hypothetical protein LSAT2_031104 [Lamellibrachia satsuma]